VLKKAESEIRRITSRAQRPPLSEPALSWKVMLERERPDPSLRSG
jgi:hypothetical protein